MLKKIYNKLYFIITELQAELKKSFTHMINKNYIFFLFLWWMFLICTFSKIVTIINFAKKNAKVYLTYLDIWIVEIELFLENISDLLHATNRSRFTERHNLFIEWNFNETMRGGSRASQLPWAVKCSTKINYAVVKRGHFKRPSWGDSISLIYARGLSLSSG